MTDYFSKVKHIIADKAGLDVTEVTPESYFEDDLNISEMELNEILTEVEESLHVDLLEDKANIESVADLLDILSEKLD